MDQVYIPQKDFKVLVRCMTYNQSKYIEDALNGFAMQQTDFPFVCLVMDDCSTDGERNVIKAWMERECNMEKAENLEIEKSFVTLVPHKSNTNCQFAFYLLKQNLYGTGDKKICMVTPWRERCVYEALCEGDDYWNHPQKIQMQVDYLDKHEECGMVYTKVKRFLQEQGVFENIWGKETDYLELLTAASQIPTLSACFRLSIYKDYQKSIKDDPQWPLGDVPLWLYFLRYHDVHFIDEATGVYRVLSESASHSKNRKIKLNFVLGAYNCRYFYANRYWGKDVAKLIVPKLVKIHLKAKLLYNIQTEHNLLKLMVSNNCLSANNLILLGMSKCQLFLYLYRSLKFKD